MRTTLTLAALLLPLHALPAAVGVVDGPAGTIEIHDTKGACQGDAKQALFKPLDQTAERVNGCWVAAQGFVFVAFFDGDVARIPLGAVKKPTTT